MIVKVKGYWTSETRTYLAAWCLAQVTSLCARLGVAPVYLYGGALMVSLGVSVCHIGPPSSPGVAPAPVILVAGHHSGQCSLVIIVIVSV